MKRLTAEWVRKAEADFLAADKLPEALEAARQVIKTMLAA